MTAAKMSGIILAAGIVLYLALAGPAYHYAFQDYLPHAEPKWCYMTLYAPLIRLSETMPAFGKVYGAYLDRWWIPEVVETIP